MGAVTVMLILAHSAKQKNMKWTIPAMPKRLLGLITTRIM
jgi:hypothetical protein